MLAKNRGVRAVVWEQIASLAEKYDVHQVILFGSRARGDYRERSDIDLAVSGGNAAAFALDVDELTDTLLRFDIVDLDGRVQPELLESIRREGIVMYEKV